MPSAAEPTSFVRQANARINALRGRPAELSPFTTRYLDAYVANLHRTPILREALARAAWWDGAQCVIHPGERLVGELRAVEPVRFHYPRGTMIDWAVVEAARNEGTWTPELEQKLDAARATIYGGWPRDEATETERLAWDSEAATGQEWAGHLVVDHPLVLRKGWRGILRRIDRLASRCLGDDEAVAEFYSAVSVTAQSVSRLIARFGEAAASLASAPPEAYSQQALTEIAERCWHLAVHPARDFRDAIQMVWFVHMLTGCDSVGRFDQYLGGYYDRDVAAGRLTRDDALALVLEFWAKINIARDIQNVTIGGSTPALLDGTNEVTYLALEATRLLRRPQPNLCVRLHPGSPQRLWDSVVDTLACGLGTPALYNDEPAVAGLRRLAVAHEDAMDYCLAGCGQTVVPGRQHNMCDTGLMNFGKILELTLHDGFDPRLGKQVGPHTGAPEELHSCHAVLEALQAQIRHFAPLEAAGNAHDWRAHQRSSGHALRSLLTADCLAEGRGIWRGGARYGGLQLEIAGLTNAADGLAAIRQVVFEDGLVTLGELVEALDANFEGHEALRAALLAAPKFGNDDPRVDDIRAELTDFLYNELQRQRVGDAGPLVPGEVVFTYHYRCGAATGATPDGRLAGQPFADSAGPAQGQGVNGPTAVLNSMARLPQSLGCTCMNLNLKFAPAVLATPEGRRKITDLFRTYFFEQSGLQLQVNVVDRDALLAAQRHPEQHRSLSVRVGGFSAYFVDLDRQAQDEIIARAEHQL